MAKIAKQTPEVILASPRSSELAKDLSTSQARSASLPKKISSTNLMEFDSLSSLAEHLEDAKHHINEMSEKEQKHMRKESKKALKGEEKMHEHAPMVSSMSGFVPQQQQELGYGCMPFRQYY